jgi:hypothetical protein
VSRLPRKLLVQNAGKTIRGILFFIIFFLYLWVEVDLRLIYHTAGRLTDFPVFFRGWDFFKEFLSHPGGLVEYLSGFLAQFLFFRSIGAVVVTLLAWLLCLCTDRIIKATDAPAFSCVRFVPPILILIIYGQYVHFFVTTVAALTALLFVNLHLKIRAETKFTVLVLLLESVFLYYIAGGAFLLFAAICAVYEFFFGRRWWNCFFCLLFAVTIPYIVGAVILQVNSIDVFTYLLPISWRINVIQGRSRMIGAAYTLYLFIPLTALSIGLWRPLVSCCRFCSNKLKRAGPASDEEGQEIRKKLPARIFSWHRNTTVTKWVFGSLFLLVITTATVFFFRDNERKVLFEVDYYLYHEMWPEVLEAAEKYLDNPLILHAADQALFHTGRLGYDLFKLHGNRQKLGVLLLTSKQVRMNYFWNVGNISLRIGLINIAEHYFVIALEYNGRLPGILKQLAYVNMIKGNIDSARVFLKALSKSLFHAGWANNYLAQIEADPNLSGDTEIQRLRNLIMEKDGPFRHSLFSGGSALLENRKNRMAFEYLMAYCLLEKNCDKIVENLHHLRDYQYSEIPKLYEEAVLVYEYETKNKVDLHGYQISQATQERYKTIMEADTVYGNKELALKELSKTYGDSFLLYYIRTIRR